MTQYKILNVKLSNLQLSKFKSGIKNGTEVTFSLLSKVVGASNDETNFWNKLLLTKINLWRLHKAGPSPSEKNIFVCFNENPFKMMKIAFYFILKALFVLKIFKLLSWLFGHVVETA